MCFGGRDKEDADGAARSRELDKVIRADEKRMAKEVKLLLLGKALARTEGEGWTCGADIGPQEPANRESRRCSSR